MTSEISKNKIWNIAIFLISSCFLLGWLDFGTVIVMGCTLLYLWLCNWGWYGMQLGLGCRLYLWLCYWGLVGLGWVAAWVWLGWVAAYYIYDCVIEVGRVDPVLYLPTLRHPHHHLVCVLGWMQHFRSNISRTKLTPYCLRLKMY